MFTVCPKCALTLTVSAAELRAGQGQVRCGRCGGVFNALLSLTEEPRPVPPVQATGPEQTAHSASGTFETIVLEGEAITQTEEYVPEERLESEIEEFNRLLAATGTHRPGEAFGARLPPAAAGPAPAGEPTAARTSDALPPEVPVATADELEGLTRPAGRARRWPWVIGSVVLAMLLAGQMINHWRDTLAQWPTIGPPLQRAYAALDRPITPRWNLAAYELRQQGAEILPGASPVVRVRFMLTNRAARAQPVPLIRVTLLDRFGRRVVEREIAPADYWPAGKTASAWLASGQRIIGVASVPDSASDSASFELAVCLAGNASAMPRCAGDRDGATF